jgi:hypothetical protein
MPVAMEVQHVEMGQIANLPRFWHLIDLSHVADSLRRAILFLSSYLHSPSIQKGFL